MHSLPWLLLVRTVAEVACMQSAILTFVAAAAAEAFVADLVAASVCSTSASSGPPTLRAHDMYVRIVRTGLTVVTYVPGLRQRGHREWPRQVRFFGGSERTRRASP